MHNLIGHEIMHGREIAHIAQVYDEGVLQRTGRIRRQPLCRGISGQTTSSRSWGDDLEKTEASHARTVAQLSNGFPTIDASDSRWRACPACFLAYRLIVVDEELRLLELADEQTRREFHELTSSTK